MRIYAPMTVNVLVVGHIRFLRELLTKGEIVVGLLTEKALKGYKKEVMPYTERKEILQSLDMPLTIVAQNSLDPLSNLFKYNCDAMASGDGFEPEEQAAAMKLGIELINVDSGSKTHSSDITKTL